MPSCAVPGSARRTADSIHAASASAPAAPASPDEQPLDEQLTDDIESARAEGQPRPHLVETGTGTRQRDRGEIPDADDQHGQRGAPEEREWTSHVADERVLERFDASEEPRGAGNRLQLRRHALQVRRVQRFELIPHLLDRRPRLQSSDAEPAIPMTGFVGALPGGQGERNPEAGVGIAEREPTRENPDDREFTSAHAKGAADDRRIGAKELAPEPVGEDDAGVVARLALIVGENPAHVQD